MFSSLSKFQKHDDDPPVAQLCKLGAQKSRASSGYQEEQKLSEVIPPTVTSLF